MQTILIIEDDREICETTRVLLEDEYKVFTAFSGAAGLDILNKETVSLVTLDHGLPDMNGLEVLKRIKKDCRIPVIMITGIGDKEVVLKSWRYKADYYFDKPFKIGELKEKISELLKPSNETVSLESLGLSVSGLSPHVQKAFKFIWTNLSGSGSEKLTLKGISAVTAVSPKHLSELFKKECGRNIYQIIADLKIEKAKELLYKGKDIKETALELGFKHPNNFCRFFKKLTGQSPSKLKKQTG